MKNSSLEAAKDLKNQAVSTISLGRLVEDKYQLLAKGVENIKDYAIFIIDADGYIATWNKGAENIKGYNAAEIIGQSFKKFYKPEAITSCYPDYELKCAKEQGRFEDEGWRVRKDGSTFWANVIITPIYDENNDHIGFTEVTRDLTECKLTEEKLQDRIKQEQLLRSKAEEAQRTTEAYKKKQAEFIATLSHELRNPLSGIANSIELLDKELTQFITKLPINDVEKQNLSVESIKQHIEAIKLCAEQQKFIVDDVLDISKIERGMIELNEVPFNPAHITATLVKMFAAKIKMKQLTVIAQTSEANLWVKGDAHRLVQVITNLLTNAIKFTRAGSITIEAKVIETQNNNANINFTVVDTGVGMTSEELNNLFKYFQQGNVRISSEHGGSGLGLFLSKQLVELMGGTIKVESKKWHGTRFSFSLSLPIITLEQTLDSIEYPLDSCLLEAHRQITVLVVEDNIINQRVLAKHLNNMGYICHVASNGKEALEIYNAISLDLIFMDIEMPIMNGLEATQTIRNIEKSLQRDELPIIGLSGNVLSEQTKQATDAGMNEYITKPYQLKTLYEKLTKVLKLKQLIKSSSRENRNSPAVSPSPRIEAPLSNIKFN